MLERKFPERYGRNRRVLLSDENRAADVDSRARAGFARTVGSATDIGAFELQAPVANDDDYSTDEDTPLSGNVLANDTDAEDDELSAILVTEPSNAQSFHLNANGSFHYTPNAHFNGTDSFTYIANDELFGSNNATVTITVNEVNDAPVADGDNYSTNEGTPLSGSNVLTNDTDVENEVLTAALVSGPAHAQLFTLNADGTFSYTPNAAFNGTDSFTYKANDGLIDSNVATVSITVNAVNDLPTAVVVGGGSCGGTSGTMNLIVGDGETDPGALVLNAFSSNTALVPNSGIVFGGSGASRTITITPVPKKTGTATITVTVSDGQATGFVTITVIVGSDKNDTLNGTSGADMIFGLGGKNTINGNAGNDLLCGGNGVDMISGGNGNDVLNGDAGNDILTGGLGNDRLEGGANDDMLTGGMGADFFTGGTGIDSATDFSPGQGDTKDVTIP